MAEEQQVERKVPQVNMKLTPEDERLIAELQRKLGATMSGVLRQGLRVLAQKEGVAA